MRRIFISFFLSILLLKYASSEDSECMTTADLTAGEKTECAQLTPQENYLCVEANDENGKNGDKPCIEVKKTCKYLKPDNTVDNGDKCAGHPTLNEEGYICKEKDGTDDQCEEIIECIGKTISEVTYNNCKNLNAGDGKCVVNADATACKVATDCEEVTTAANSESCTLFEVEEPQKCVYSETDTKCVKEDKLCDEVKNGATDVMCEKLTPKTDSKCVKDGDECKSKTLCGKGTYVSGCSDFATEDNDHVCVDTKSACVSKLLCEKEKYNKDSTVCEDLPTTSPDNICKKHDTENKCVEVAKPDNDGENNEETKSTGKEETKSSEEETKSTGKEETKSSEEEETKSTGKEETKSNEEAGPTQGTETDLSKDNKGTLLNLSLYTLLIYILF